MKFLLLFVSVASAVELTVKNECSFPVWFASQPNHGKPALNDGIVKLNQEGSYTYQIPSCGWAGRFWPKVGCDRSGYNCEFGDSVPPCPKDGCQPPADTKVEFNFPSQPPHQDSWYDISLVDGYSLPMRIDPRGNNHGACVSTNCHMSLDACPADETHGLGDLRVHRNGKVLACLSPCKKWNYPPPYGMGRSEREAPGDMMCCPTPPISPGECRNGPVEDTQYVNLIHAACPTAYSYAYDDEAGLHNCPGETSFDVTLCPDSINWNGNNWAFACDFHNNDLSNAKTPGDQCGPTCSRTSGCTHFTWTRYEGGTCWMKKGAVTKDDAFSTGDDNMVCGVL